MTAGSKILGEISHTARIKRYAGGRYEILACDKPVFRETGWEEVNPAERAQRTGAGDVARAVRRAKSSLRDIALCNPMTYFITLTLDRREVDRYDAAAMQRRLNVWLSNQVQRRGLAYVLVPELHKDGALHYHGLINAALPVVDSGTVIPAGGGKPRRPRRGDLDSRTVYNLPGWKYGFSTALELVGDYGRAVSYVCKYIGKNLGGKIGGRWYLSGGALLRPQIEYADVDIRELEDAGGYLYHVPEAAASFCVWRNF